MPPPYPRAGQTGPEPTGLTAFQRHIAHQGHQNDCTPEIAARVVQATRTGLSHATSAKRAGIEPKRLQLWLMLGAQTYEEGGPYRELYLAVSQAEAEWVQERHAALETLAMTDPHVAYKVHTFLLKTRFPDEYGDRNTTTHEGVVNAVHAHVTTQRLESALARALDTAQDGEPVAEIESTGELERG